MILVNTDYISGKELETIALVDGKDSFHIELATKEMVKNAEKLGADGIVNIRYTATAYQDSTVGVVIDIYAYGTAVKFK